MITCQLLKQCDHAIIIKLLTHQCDFLYKVKILYKHQYFFMLTIPVNHDHGIIQNVNKNLLI